MKITYFSFVLCLVIVYSCQNTSQENLNQPNLVFSVTDLSIGKNRLAFGIIQSGKGSLTPDNVVVETYFLDGNSEELIEKTIAVPYLWPNNKTIFVTEVNFHQSGKWGIGVKLAENIQTSAFLEVKQKSLTPDVGEKAIQSQTKSTSSLQNIASITSDNNPYLPFYESTLIEALNSKTPTVLFFTSPGYCKTATCGPQMQVMKNLHQKTPDVNFVHIEIYNNPSEIQGNLSSAEVSQPVYDWSIPSEPWTFLINSNQIITAKFEGFVSKNELLFYLQSLN
ncbi:MAG: TlpA family protein disulfide reductase [Dehalococcoidia bacterium]